MGVMIIGGYVRLVLTLPTSSFVSSAPAAGAAAMRATLTESLQLSESLNNADVENYKIWCK